MLEGYKTYPGPGQRKKTSSPVGYFYKTPQGRVLPRPPAIPPPDYMEAVRNRNTFGRPVTRHQSAREPMTSLVWRERNVRIDPAVAAGGQEGNNSGTVTVVFNTNEQKTATIGRVPRVSKMSSFYGAHDLNTSQDNRTNSIKKNKKQGKESFMVPTVYRIGSLHLSEGVSFKKYNWIRYLMLFLRFMGQTKPRLKVSEGRPRTWETPHQLWCRLAWKNHPGRRRAESYSATATPAPATMKVGQFFLLQLGNFIMVFALWTVSSMNPPENALV